MKKLYILFLIIQSLIFTSSDPFFGNNNPFIPSSNSDQISLNEIAYVPSKKIDEYLNDFKNRIPPQFKLNPFYFKSVKFWFLIYTQFNSQQIVIHDKENLDLIYKILDFSSLKDKKLNRNTYYFLQDKISKEKVSDLKNHLLTLSKNPTDLSENSIKILNSLKMGGTSLPNSNPEKALFFKKLSENIRVQSGQKNFINDGIQRSLPFENFLTFYFNHHQLPPELLAIPFLESSFNPVAQSKVNALGAWQFMPFIAKHFVPKRRDDIDYRRNVGISSISAAFLMKQNFNILKSWDLAVTAYNSGTKHILNTKRQIGSQSISLIDVIEKGKSNSFGFASKNFYSEFLALVHTLAYRDELFGFPPKERDNNSNDLNFYISKCDLILEKVLSPYEISEIDSLNHHFFNFKKKFHKGLIITSKLSLSSKYFYKLTNKEITKFKPIDWPKLLKNYSCSTK